VEYLGWFNHTRLHQALEAPRARAAPHVVEGQTLDGRPLRRPVASEVLIS